MMFLSKETRNKDQSIKTQMLLSLYKDDSSNAEKKREKMAFLKMKKMILPLKNNFP